MSYSYKTEKPKIFTEEGQVKFLKVRDHINNLLAESGAFTMAKAWKPITGDCWEMMAYVDRLVELGEIKEITHSCAGQDRIFTKGTKP